MRRLLLGIRFLLDEVDLRASGLDDLLVVSLHILTVALEHIELVAELVAPQQIESGTSRLDAWEDRALLRHRLKCSSLAVQLEDFGYRV